MNPLLIALAGLTTGAGLIIAIGPQNVLVLRNGVARTHVVPIVAVCAVSDLILIIAGVVGLGAVVSGHPAIVTVATVLGGGYVIVLGLMAARRSRVAASMTVDSGADLSAVARGGTRWAAIGTALALTWLNPHVYLDTVLTLGAIANSHGPDGKWAFAVGACAASILWFCALGFAAGKLAPLFARPRAWQILDAGVAVVMLAVGITLIASVM